VPGDRRAERQLPLIGRRGITRDEGGQAVVEFALVLPILLAVVTAIFSFGMTFKDYLTLTDAVRAGARVAVVSRNTPDPTGAAKAAVIDAGTDLGLTAANVDVQSTWQPGSDVKVTGTYPYSISVFGIPVNSGSLTSSTTVRVE
jgi:Flp pilus assembly protein TadG